MSKICTRLVVGSSFPFLTNRLVIKEKGDPPVVLNSVLGSVPLSIIN